MSMTLSAAAIFPLAGAANAALLAAAIAVRAVARRSRAGIYGAMFLAGAAVAVTVITLGHAGVDSGALFPLIEGAMTLAAGPLFLLFIAALLGRKMVAWPLFAPLALFLIAAAVAPAFVLDNVSIEWLVAAQMAFTAAAGWVAWAAPTQGGRIAERRRNMALLAVGAIACMHLAQVLRFLSDAEILRDVVPYVTATMFFALAGLVYFGARAAPLDPILSAQPASSETLALADRLDTAIAANLKNAKLTLADVSAAAGVTSPVAAKALADARGATFKDYVLRLRVREAERLLRDPAEARTSMEAVGLLVGFGSRSAFYQAFRDQLGVSPAAYRQETRPET